MNNSERIGDVQPMQPASRPDAELGLADLLPAGRLRLKARDKGNLWIAGLLYFLVAVPLSGCSVIEFGRKKETEYERIQREANRPYHEWKNAQPPR